MRRWFLLTLGGLGASAAAVVLLPGTAHALGPKAGTLTVPVVAPAAPPTVLPTAALPPVPRVVVPPTPLVVHKVVSRVVDRVRTAIPATTLHAPIPVPSLTVGSHPKTRAVAPSAMHALHSSRTRVAPTRGFAANPSVDTTHATMSATGPSPSSQRGATLAGLLVPSTGNAITTARPSFSTLFVFRDAPAFAPDVASTRVSSSTGDRTRPGFLVGSARPG